MYFFHEKQTLHVLRNFTISFAFYGKPATFSKFMNNQLSYQKTFSFWEKTQILKVVRSFISSVEFYRLIATFTGIKKIKFFLQNSIFFKKTNDERFEKSYYFSRIPRQFCYFHQFLKYSFFSKNPSIFRKKIKVLRNRNISVEFYDNFAIFSDFEEFMFFLEKLL